MAKPQPHISAEYDEFEELVDKKNELMRNIENGDLPDEQKKIELTNITNYFWKRVNEIVLGKQEEAKRICEEPHTNFDYEEVGLDPSDNTITPE